jgi:hypothetical protein
VPLLSMLSAMTPSSMRRQRSREPLRQRLQSCSCCCTAASASRCTRRNT